MSVDKYFSQKNIAELFPTLVWVYDLSTEHAKKVNGDILGWLDKHVNPRPKPTNDLSLQTRFDLQNSTAFRRFAPILDASVKDVMKFLQLRHNQFLITGAWANLSEPGIRHHRHSHPNNYLSGVYYVTAPSGGDTIRFYDPRGQVQVIRPEVSAANKYTGDSITINVKSGRLVLFHSWLEHSVDSNSGNGERVSLAVNVMFKRFAEIQGQPMWEPKIKETR